MARLHPYPKDSLQSLLQLTTEEVHSTLIASPQGDSIFFQNFSALALKAVKYLTASLNHLSPDQSLGGVIDRLGQGLQNAMQEYRSRNVFIHSVHSPSSASSREDLQKEDEIYHFLNTRNNLLPVECLSTYENDRQRKELQQFVEEMKKHQKGGTATGGKREHKRSLILPKDHNFQLKINRKRTFDPQPLQSHHFKPLPQKRQEEQVSNNPISQDEPLLPSPAKYEHVETQTQSHIMAASQTIQQQQQDHNRKSQAQVPSQPQLLSGGISQAILSVLSHNQLTVPSKKQKQKKKGLLESDNKKKKTKFASSNQNITKGELTPINTSKSLGKKKLLLPAPASQCSLKLVKLNQKILSICSKEIDIVLGKSQSGEILININYTSSQNQLPPVTALSQAIILDATGTNPTIITNPSDKSHPSRGEVQSQQDKIIADAISALVNQNQSSSSLNGEWQVGEGRKKYLLSKSKRLPKQSQRIPISTVKISPTKEGGSDLTQTLHHFTRLRQTQSFLIADGTAKVNIKRKKYTGDRHLFTSFIISQGENEHNLSQHLRTSKLNLLPFQTDPLLSMMKKDSDCSSIDKNQSSPSTNNFPSFSKNNQPQSLTSSVSHDYLISRQRSDPKQLLNRLMELEKDEKQQGGGHSLHRETPTFHRTTSNCSEDPHRDTPGRPRESQMIRISNAHRMNEEMMNQLTQGHSRFFQNNKISSDMQKDKEKEREREREKERQGLFPLPPQKQPSFLNKNHLSLIPQNDPNDTHQAKTSLLNKSPSNSLQKPPLDLNKSASTSIPHKSIFLRQSTQILPVRLPMAKLKPQGRTSNSFSNQSKSFKSLPLQKPQSTSLHEEGDKMTSLDAELLRRKLRARGNKDKLEHYLELVQATHLKFCGRDCDHLKELYSGKEGSVTEQIFRLVKRLN